MPIDGENRMNLLLARFAAPALAFALAASLAGNVAGWAKLSAERNAHNSFRAATAQAEQVRSETARKAEAGHRARERAQADTLQAITQKAANEKTRLAADLRAAVDSLRNRPQRPAAGGGAVPTGAADQLACTGASLFAEDADAALREAARADSLRLQLAACQAAYNGAVILTAP